MLKYCDEKILMKCLSIVNKETANAKVLAFAENLELLNTSEQEEFNSYYKYLISNIKLHKNYSTYVVGELKKTFCVDK